MAEKGFEPKSSVHKPSTSIFCTVWVLKARKPKHLRPVIYSKRHLLIYLDGSATNFTTFSISCNEEQKLDIVFPCLDKGIINM